MNMLIRSTLIALSQAGATGNYTVLRDLGSPKFQDANTAADLVENFASLRRQKIDFTPIFFFDPKLVRPPQVQDDGLLRLTGYFETTPKRIVFDMGFENIAGTWQISALLVELRDDFK